ncbi:portal protein [Chitiniphilus shinanonensis]|uniref:portal protein n=1 Tax=Chitiniphilus shinanonensis TaxID=553088 RepID=UPI003044028E
MVDQVSREVWQRHEYAKQRGHLTYMRAAKTCEEYWLGAGLQWRTADREALREVQRPAIELNMVWPAVNTAIGYQINSRMDIGLRPRGEADDALAEVLQKVAMQVADNCHYPWLETEVYADGIIQQRGYFDIRMNFDDNIKGEISIDTLDPLDVVPDPDAKSYDPAKWGDVLVTRWLTLDEIAQRYGEKARKAAEGRGLFEPEQDFGADHGESEDLPRNKFGDETSIGVQDGPDAYRDSGRKIRIVERQSYRYERTEVLVSPAGDVRALDGFKDMSTRLSIIEDAVARGSVVTKRLMRRVRWQVTTRDVTLLDDWSPYPWFTVVPFFPYFRRGVTRGMVDNAIDPQDLLNKSMSQFLHVINTAANSGWIVEENSLVNMTSDDLAEVGAKTGLVIVHKHGTTPPQKIAPNQIPTGVERVVQRMEEFVKTITGMSDAMQGRDSAPEVSGVALQSKQFQAQMQLAMPLDNLRRTRHMLAERLVWLVQHYYTWPMIYRITEFDDYGKERQVPHQLNWPAEDGSLLNDLTLGEYDVVVTDQPTQVTWQQSQFNSALEMRKTGIPIPDPFMIRLSPLSDKEEIAKSMAEAQTPPADPLLDARVALTQAQADHAKANAEKADAEASVKRVEALYSSGQTAQVIASNPVLAPMADEIALSAGLQDRNAAPFFPEAGPGGASDVPGGDDGNPLTPDSPAVGMGDGLRTARPDGVVPGMAGN